MITNHTMMQRRGLLGGLLALAAPAVIRTPGLLMPVRMTETQPVVSVERVNPRLALLTPQVWNDEFFNAFVRHNRFIDLLDAS